MIAKVLFVEIMFPKKYLSKNCHEYCHGLIKLLAFGLIIIVSVLHNYHNNSTKIKHMLEDHSRWWIEFNQHHNRQINAAKELEPIDVKSTHVKRSSIIVRTVYDYAVPQLIQVYFVLFGFSIDYFKIGIRKKYITCLNLSFIFAKVASLLLYIVLIDESYFQIFNVFK